MAELLEMVGQGGADLADADEGQVHDWASRDFGGEDRELGLEWALWE